MRWDAFGVSVAALGLLLASGGASAQVPPSETKFYVQTRSGVPAMCGIEFWHPYRDHIYAGGAATVATGSLGWLRSGQSIFMSIKVVGAEVPTSAAPGAAPQMFQIHNAFVTAGKRHYFVREQVECERPLGFCGLFAAEPDSVDVLSAIGVGEISVQFAHQSKKPETAQPSNQMTPIRITEIAERPKNSSPASPKCAPSPDVTAP